MMYELGVTKLANFALNAIGIDMINSIDQEVDPARQIKEYYGVVLKRVLSEYDWNFARRTVDIYEVIPPDEYKNYDYAMGLPDNFVAARRVVPEQYYEIYDNSTLRCNIVAERTVEVLDPADRSHTIPAVQKYIEMTYTKLDIDPMKMNAGFFQYLAYSIAQEIAFMLTGDTSITQMILNLANSYQAIAHVEDSTNSRHKEYGSKPYWYRNTSDFYSRRYRDGGPDATESFN